MKSLTKTLQWGIRCDLSGDEYYVTERVSDLTSGSLWIGVPKNRKEGSYVVCC